MNAGTIDELARLRLRVLSLCTVALIVAVGFSAIYSRSSPDAAQQEHLANFDGYKSLNAELATCIDRDLRITGADKPSFASLQGFWRLCENQMYDQLLLNDFMIRREKFQESSLDERVNLWLVVAITMSGVLLAALQLVMSYRLADVTKAESAPSSEMILEHGKLSMKSAYVGLLIMALSLAFFAIYVKWIYEIHEVETQKPSNLTEEAAPKGKLLDVQGSLGWPTDSDKAKAGAPPAEKPK